METVFGIAIGGWIEQLEYFKKNATKDIFFIIFQNLDNILLKMYEVLFLEAFS